MISFPNFTYWEFWVSTIFPIIISITYVPFKVNIVSDREFFLSLVGTSSGKAFVLSKVAPAESVSCVKESTFPACYWEQQPPTCTWLFWSPHFSRSFPANLGLVLEKLVFSQRSRQVFGFSLRVFPLETTFSHRLLEMKFVAAASFLRLLCWWTCTTWDGAKTM